MITETDHNSLRYSRVEISGNAISGFKGGKITRTVLREKILDISLAYDTSAAYPFCQFFLGFTMAAFGFMGLVVTFFASIGKISLVENSENAVLPMVPVVLWIMLGAGLWALAGVFRARFHLLIRTEKGTAKVFFEKSADLAEIRQFIRRAKMKFGYEIDLSILEKIKPS